MMWTSARIAAAFVIMSVGASASELRYQIVGTGQTQCYDDHSEIAFPKAGQPFFGQDAQYSKRSPRYRLDAVGLTVYDCNTGLYWQRAADTNGDGKLTADDKLTIHDALAMPGKLNARKFGGYGDWRLPTIKELYSLIEFSGIDPNVRQSSSTSVTPFIDTGFFRFVYGDEQRGERVIDAQYLSSTRYAVKGATPFDDKVFGVNFADGRIKGYGLRMRDGWEKTFFVLCVRGNQSYGRNDFKDNGDGTVSDRATGLTWTRDDSGVGMDWRSALAWVQKKNAENYLGCNDWRLPDAKELQSIVDYSRSPGNSRSAAISPVFHCTAIKNESGQADYPYYWTGTTHASQQGDSNAVYVAFGRAAGWMGPPGTIRGGRPEMADEQAPRHFMDVHGAGAQRSDPKAGAATMFPQGRGPQGDVVRINNYVRMVRGGLNK